MGEGTTGLLDACETGQAVLIMVDGQVGSGKRVCLGSQGRQQQSPSSPVEPCISGASHKSLCPGQEH